MDSIEPIVIVEALLQLSMITMVGLYFIFSNTIVRTLTTLESGALVMVEINKTILNPVFMGFFILSGIAGFYFFVFTEGLLAIAGLVFFIGTTLVTIIKNVPLNNRLLHATEQERDKIWQMYSKRWVFWNHVRTVSGLLAGLLLSM